MWHSGEAMGWWMVLGSVWFVIFWAIVIWAVVKLTSQQPPSDNQASPLDIAQRRYARGEIDRDEFEQIRKDLAS
jgi:putative membrane protein